MKAYFNNLKGTPESMASCHLSSRPGKDGHGDKGITVDAKDILDNVGGRDTVLGGVLVVGNTLSYCDGFLSRGGWHVYIIELVCLVYMRVADLEHVFLK